MRTIKIRMNFVFVNDGCTLNDLAKLAFDTYGETAEWKTYDGKPMPQWAEAGGVVQGRWCAAVGAVRKVVLETAERERAECPALIAGELLQADSDDRADWLSLFRTYIRVAWTPEGRRERASHVEPAEWAAEMADAALKRARARWPQSESAPPEAAREITP